MTEADSTASGWRPGEPGALGPSAALPLAGADLDDLLRELLQRVDEVQSDQHRLRLLLDAVVSIAGDLSLDSVLERIVRTASELAGARYAALGVLDIGPERRLQAFVTHGLTPEQHQAIGNLPTGRGLLGVIIDRPAPLRLHDLTQHAESYGFPANHPPMSSFLGVPIRIRDKVFGNLYLTEKSGGGDFTAQDEAITVALAAAAGVVIENAQLYRDAERRERWLEATAEITSMMLGPLGHAVALNVVADRGRVISGADISAVVLRQPDGSLVLEAVSGLTQGSVPDEPFTIEGGLAGDVVASGDALVIEDVVRESGVAAQLVRDHGWPELGPAVLVPLRTPEAVEGVLALVWLAENAGRVREVDVELPRRFAEQAALALQVARARAAQEKLAVLEDRDRIGRDLHDLVIQRLFAIGLSLENTTRRIEDPEAARRVVDAVDDVDATIKDIRRSIFALTAPPETPDIRMAVGEVVDRAAVSLGLRPELRFEGPVHTEVSPTAVPHLLAVLGEALSNVVRHAGATQVGVLLEASDMVRLTVTDDGRGISDDAVPSGLLNMRDRAERLGGRFTTGPVEGGGTVVTWEVPTASRWVGQG